MNRHVFHGTEKTVTGLSMGIETSSMISKMVGAVGRLAGFEGNTICYTLRYMTGNKLDHSGMYQCSLFLPHFVFSMNGKSLNVNSLPPNFTYLNSARQYADSKVVDCSTALRESAIDNSHGSQTFFTNYLDCYVISALI